MREACGGHDAHAPAGKPVTGIDAFVVPMRQSAFLPPRRRCASPRRLRAPMPLSLSSRHRSRPLALAASPRRTVASARRNRGHRHPHADAAVDELVSDTVGHRPRTDRAQRRHRTLPDLLARLPGVQIAANGGIGKTSSVFIRGAEARHTILSDRRRALRLGHRRRAAGRTSRWSMIDRIEVRARARPPRSTASDGVGGVVQIFTRKGKRRDPVFSPRASATLGSRELQADHGRLQRRLGRLRPIRSDAQRTIEQGLLRDQPPGAVRQLQPRPRPLLAERGQRCRWATRSTRTGRSTAACCIREGSNHYDDGPDRDTRDTVRTADRLHRRDAAP